MSAAGCASTHCHASAAACFSSSLVTAIADGPFPDNVLLAPGNFSSYGPILSVDNLTASEGSFQPASDDPEDARLSAVDGCSNRRLFVRSNSFVQVTPPESVV